MPRLKQDRRPLHIQAYDMLLGLIRDGIYQPGDQFPAESDLAEQLGISRPTLREALHHLERRGFIVRRHGVGTFVSRNPAVFESGLEVLESIAQKARRLGVETEVAHLTIRERSATPREREVLVLDDGRPGDVTVVDRVITVEREAVAYLQDVVPRQYLAPDDLREGFSGSVLDVLVRQKRVEPVTSRAQVMAEGASPSVADHLGVSEGASLLKFVSRLYGVDQAILDYSISYFIPGHFKFYVTRRVERGARTF